MVFYLLETILIPFIKALSIGAAGLLLVGVKIDIKKLIVFGLPITAISYINCPVKLPLGGLILMHVIIYSIAIFFVYRIPYRMSFMIALIGICIQISAKVIIFTCFTFITSRLSYSPDYGLTKLFLSFIEDLFLVILALVFNMYNLSIWNSKTIENSYKHIKDPSFNKSFSMVILFFTQIILIFLFFYGDYPVTHYPLDIDLSLCKYPFLAVIISALPIAAIVITKKQITLIQNEINYKIKLESFALIDDLIKRIQIKQHDFKHELQVVYGLLEIGEAKEAREYISKSFSEVSATTEILKTDDLKLTALIYSKMCIADRRKIKIETNIESSFYKDGKYDDDLYIVLGNLIDNALEASICNKSDEKMVSVILKNSLEGCIITVKNFGKSIGTNKRIFDLGFSSKIGGKGIGLYSVKKIVKKHNGKIGIAYIDGQNCFEVIIPGQNS